MKTITRFALACIAACAVSTASASVIVDTGPGSVVNGGWSLFHDQSLANSFTISQDETITGVNGWLGGNMGTLRIGIRSAANALPGALLFAADAAPTQALDNAWVGASNLNWSLSSGTYFVSFEVPDGYTFSGAMGLDFPNPTGSGAFTDGSGVWHDWGNPQVGFQVFGDPTHVPEPTSLALMGLAIGALALTRRKRAA